ncbi:enoyl-CoA hydratase-related protein [Rhodococcus sp. 27YEA15]|uniref:enoyl-CoA hydratase-related protein n=1 Tax=Rhodococcus sp. 27YEA15 TaxID=3156259 RepID=UPI003C7D7B30
MTETNGIAEVVIDRPPVNALARTTYREIKETFEDFRERDDLSAVIFTGAGTRAFCGGRDVKDLQEERKLGAPANIADPYLITREAFWAVRHCALPVICAVNGPAVGAGVALVACSDIAIAVDTATFSLTEIDVGVLGGASFAQRLVGPSMARRMMFTAERVPASEVFRRGGLDSVVSSEDLMDEARALAALIASKSPVAVRMAKASLVRSDSLPLEAAYHTEQDYTRHLAALSASTDALAGFGKN